MNHRRPRIGQLENLLNEFTGVSYVEAWNEPNHESSAVKFYVKAVAAAHYMNAAYSVCQVHGCTAIAGDFLDESNMSAYEAEYISGSNLNPKDPPNWGMHPYAAVDTEKTTTVEAFRNGLPAKGSENISFTEVGAYYCKKGESISGSENASREAYQAKYAAYLVNTLIPHTTNLEHVFYYEFAFEGTKRINCSNVEDTELYAPPSEGQANQPRSAAGIVWGPEGRPSASTGGASNLAPRQATLGGSVNPKGIADTKYYFRYGTTTEYRSGSTTPEDAGQGLNWQNESTSISGLQPGTTYHFLIVATNEDGTEEGKDGEFTTPGPVEAGTSEASGLTEVQATLNGTVNPRGYDAKYYFEYGETPAYGMTTSLGDAGAGLSAVPENVIIMGLQPGMEYHYRIVATSGGVTSEGRDHTFTTDAHPTLAVDKEGQRWYAAEGPNHTLYGWFENTKSEIGGPRELGKAGTTYSAPTLAVDKEGQRWYAAEGPNHTLYAWFENTKSEIGGPRELGKRVLRIPRLRRQWIRWASVGFPLRGQATACMRGSKTLKAKLVARGNWGKRVLSLQRGAGTALPCLVLVMLANRRVRRRPGFARQPLGSGADGGKSPSRDRSAVRHNVHLESLQWYKLRNPKRLSAGRWLLAGAGHPLGNWIRRRQRPDRCDPEGDAAAVWETFPPVSSRTIQAAVKSHAGSWSAPVTLADTGGAVGSLQIAIDSRGNAVAVWEDHPVNGRRRRSSPGRTSTRGPHTLASTLRAMRPWCGAHLKVVAML
jgi:hypothetical protein